MNDVYDYHSAMERLRAANKSMSSETITGRYNRIMLDMETWTPGRLIPGRYPVDVWTDARHSERYEVPYWRFASHWWPEIITRHARGRFVVCGRGTNDFAPTSLCPACMVPDHDGLSTRFAYNFLGLGTYHEEKLPHTNPEKARQGKTITNWRLCQQTPTNRNCPYCNKGLPYVLGYYGHLELGYQDQKVLDTIGDQIATHCHCGGKITVERAACNSCNQVIADVRTSGYSDADFARILANGGVCPHCNQLNRTFVPILGCTSCTKPRPLTIFDVDLQFRNTKKDNGKRGVIEVALLLDQNNQMRVGPVNEAYAASLNERGVKLIPHDLPAIHAPMPPPKMQRQIHKHFGISVGPEGDSNAVPRLGLPMATGPQTPPQPAPLPPIFQQPQLPAPQPAAQAMPPAPAPAASPQNPVFGSISMPAPGTHPVPASAPMPMMPAPAMPAPAPMPMMPAPSMPLPAAAPPADTDADDDDLPPDLD